MSLEKPSPPGRPVKAAPSTQEDPAVLLSTSWQKLEEDWAADLLAAVGGPDSGEDGDDNSIPPDEKITKILEFKVPVSNDTKPQGSLAVENIWDPNFVKTIEPSSFPSENLVPVFFVDATAEEPCLTAPPPPSTEESFILPQSPPEEPADSLVVGGSFSTPSSTSPFRPPEQHFLISVPEGNSLPTAVCIPASSYMKTPPMSPETRFLEKHNIMKWVIDDQDEGDIPGLPAGISGAPLSQITATVTSPSALDSKAECLAMASQYKVVDNSEVKPSQRPRYYFIEHELHMINCYIKIIIYRKRERQPETSPCAVLTKPGRMETSFASTSESEFSQLSDSTDLTDDEASKYRRMRDLNNEASRRCRDRRRMKQQNMLLELDQQRNKNLILKKKCDSLQLKVRKIKNYVLKSFKNPQLEIALAHQRRIFGETAISSENIGIFSDPKDLPEVDCSWIF